MVPLHQSRMLAKTSITFHNVPAKKRAAALSDAVSGMLDEIQCDNSVLSVGAKKKWKCVGPEFFGAGPGHTIPSDRGVTRFRTETYISFMYSGFPQAVSDHVHIQNT